MQAYFLCFYINTAIWIKVDTRYGTWGNDSFPRVVCPFFTRKDLAMGQNFVTATCCIRFAGFNSCVMKQGQNDLNFQCDNVCTALANCPRYTIEINQYSLCVHQIAYCPCKIHPMYKHEGACPRFTSQQHASFVPNLTHHQMRSLIPTSSTIALSKLLYFLMFAWPVLSSM